MMYVCLSYLKVTLNNKKCTFYRALKGKGYSLEERGKIELRGYGTLGTYYLVGNENASIEDIAGRTKQEVSYINEGKEKGKI